MMHARDGASSSSAAASAATHGAAATSAAASRGGRAFAGASASKAAKRGARRVAHAATGGALEERLRCCAAIGRPVFSARLVGQAGPSIAVEIGGGGSRRKPVKAADDVATADGPRIASGSVF